MLTYLSVSGTFWVLSLLYEIVLRNSLNFQCLSLKLYDPCHQVFLQKVQNCRSGFRSIQMHWQFFDYDSRKPLFRKYYTNILPKDCIVQGKFNQSGYFLFLQALTKKARVALLFHSILILKTIGFSKSCPGIIFRASWP